MRNGWWECWILKLLDVCATAKDVFSQIKQDVGYLLSMIHWESDVDDFIWYLTSRKNTKKMIQKSLKDLKESVDEDNESEALVGMLKEVKAVTLACCV